MYYVGEINFAVEELIKPGETKTVSIRFLKIGEIEKFIRVGQKWFIHEGPRLVAYGEILEV